MPCISPYKTKKTIIKFGTVFGWNNTGQTTTIMTQQEKIREIVNDVICNYSHLDEIGRLEVAINQMAEWELQQSVEWLSLHMPFGTVSKEFRDGIIDSFIQEMKGF